jgi:hypothetical protein
VIYSSLRILVWLQSLTSGRQQASGHVVAYLLISRHPCPRADSGSRSARHNPSQHPQSTTKNTPVTRLSLSRIAILRHCLHHHYAFYPIIHYWLVHPRHTKVTESILSSFTLSQLAIVLLSIGRQFSVHNSWHIYRHESPLGDHGRYRWPILGCRLYTYCF